MIADEAAARRWVEALPEWDERVRERLEVLVQMLADENKTQNLVSASSLEAVWRRHIADSAQLLQYAPPLASPWLDLGTGAGFPGLVIAILRPDLDLVLVESRRLRGEWLQRVIDALDLTRVRVEMQRLEKVKASPAAVISARAFASLDRTLDLSARFSTSETVWLLPKGRSSRHELNALRDWQHMFHVEQSHTDAEAGIITGRLVGRKDTHG